MFIDLLLLGFLPEDVFNDSLLAYLQIHNSCRLRIESFRMVMIWLLFDSLYDGLVSVCISSSSQEGTVSTKSPLKPFPNSQMTQEFAYDVGSLRCIEHRCITHPTPQRMVSEEFKPLLRTAIFTLGVAIRQTGTIFKKAFDGHRCCWDGNFRAIGFLIESRSLFCFVLPDDCLFSMLMPGDILCAW